MKNYAAQITAICILFFSCSKTEDAPRTVIAKKIDRILISPEYLLQSKSSDVYLGIRYFKDYTDKDNITLTLNGQTGLQLSETSSQIEGNNLLFKFGATNQNGDYKVRCTIKNDQNSLEKDLILRFVNDYSINTVWTNLDKNYTSAFASYADRLKTSGYALRTLTNNSPQVQFGSYFENLGNLNIYVGKYFIPALPGTYSLTYNTLGLQEIRILNADPLADQSFVIAKFYTDLSNNYGNYISRTSIANGKITIYKSGDYTLSVTETPSLVSTIITKS
ncbi:hypothetical protein EV200_105383 [Pedobacter psychrotolerans]|uniref:Uncharacterized protein n=1 Tax=Pedobacter psychrotolerans TaxID=1843235 RepID=A0A4R2H9X2_9SPHI|nr:hypothetical protein [Pedobacter psychrotolerans]TCO23909.1 hypothetical protein EV200_105383 [Pedobacter psychrotolerans]GGE63529.1 hypothetical protein GCM10011413_32410 [Pedobacter psychrotolerans]